MQQQQQQHPKMAVEVARSRQRQQQSAHHLLKGGCCITFSPAHRRQTQTSAHMWLQVLVAGRHQQGLGFVRAACAQVSLAGLAPRRFLAPAALSWMASHARVSDLEFSSLGAGTQSGCATSGPNTCACTLSHMLLA